MAELVLALDLPKRSEALDLLDQLPAVRWVKLGSVLTTAEGAPLVRELARRGLRVFLDLKWHDIPNTVAGAVRAAAGLGAAMATVHASGGPAMLQAAASAAPGSLAVVGVTVLTSTADSASAAPVADEVERLARLSMHCGLAGVVCSALEAARVRAALGPNALIVVPGIRRAGDHNDDQRRTATVQEAVRAGATHLVIGRTVLQAKDPVAAWRSCWEEITS